MKYQIIFKATLREFVAPFIYRKTVNR